MDQAQEKAKSIRLLILDVDGVLTSGLLYYDQAGNELKSFHIHDGLGLQLLHRAGIQTAIISGRHSKAAARRAQELEITHAYFGIADKLPVYETLKQQLQLTDAEIAYMGDDLPDLPLLKRAGFAVTVPETPRIIQQHVDFITEKRGGKGAVREICEYILTAQGKFQTMLQSYLL